MRESARLLRVGELVMVENQRRAIAGYPPVDKIRLNIEEWNEIQHEVGHPLSLVLSVTGPVYVEGDPDVRRGRMVWESTMELILPDTADESEIGFGACVRCSGRSFRATETKERPGWCYDCRMRDEA